MKRKEFVRNIGLMGVGIAFAPIQLSVAGPGAKTYRLPAPAVHIPHGNFAATELEKLVLPEFGLECTVQQFLRNGISETHDDLTVYTFRSNTEVLNLCCTRDGRSFTDGNIEGLNPKLDGSGIRASFRGRDIILVTA